jgi:hypothetical protein
MYKGIRAAIESRINQISMGLTVVILIVWVVSRFVPMVDRWLQTQNLLNVVILALLADVWAVTVEIKRQNYPEKVHLNSDQVESSRELLESIEKNRSRKVDLIELSSTTVETLLEGLRKNNCKIRLLVQNPKFAVNKFQQARIIQRLSDLTSLTLKDYRACEIRLYCMPGSIRGRLVDERFVNVGWYTYSYDEIGVYGHDNPLISASVDSREGLELHDMFKRALESPLYHKN